MILLSIFIQLNWEQVFFFYNIHVLVPLHTNTLITYNVFQMKANIQVISIKINKLNKFMS
jgi:hypothetical protein